MTRPEDRLLEQFEEALAALDLDHYELTLFIIGASDLSARAISNVRELCERHLPGRYELSVVDLFADPDAARLAGVFATPTLMKSKPLPVRRLVGDLSQTDRVLAALQIYQVSQAEA